MLRWQHPISPYADSFVRQRKAVGSGLNHPDSSHHPYAITFVAFFAHPACAKRQFGSAANWPLIYYQPCISSNSWNFYKVGPSHIREVVPPILPTFPSLRRQAPN
jgi:hypothetical protein